MTQGLKLSPADRKKALEELRLLDAVEAAQHDPKALINEIRYFDPVTQKYVEFRMFPPEGWESPLIWTPTSYGSDLKFKGGEGAEDWFWQATFVDWLHDPNLHAYLVYKARQLGITLIACAYALWLMVCRPGVNAAAFSYEEGEAFKLSQAVWDMYKSLPPIFKQGIEVDTPKRNTMPTEWVKLLHPNGLYSTFQALPATGLHGHGGRISLVIQDELARQRYGRQIYEAATPAVLSRGGKWLGISTANGVSNPETGEGNFFHHLYDTREEKKIGYVFLPWNAEPTRGEEWYSDVALKLPTAERNRQYPLNEEDGFMLSGFTYFEADVLAYYRDNVIEPIRRGQFMPQGVLRAKFADIPNGMIQIFELPRPEAKYVISADTSTGRAEDYTSVDILDAASGALVAHMKAKIESPRAAFQLFWLGKLYNTALIAVEKGGGYGEALITHLRDGTLNLPIYPRLYRHTLKTKSGAKQSTDYGFPMNQSTRPQVLEALKYATFEHRLPWVSHDHLYEMGTFVHKDTTPTPRAEDGCNDDCVMSLAIGWFLYEHFGDTPARERKKRNRTSQEYQPSPARAGD